MKKLFLDEMFKGHKDYFELLGYDVMTVGDVRLDGTSDAEVVKYAGEKNMLFVTQDGKAYDLAKTVGVDAFLVTNGLIVKAIIDALTVGGKQ